MTNAIAARLRGRDHKDCPCYCCDGAREIERLEHELKEAQADAAQSRGWGEAAIARMAESTQETGRDEKAMVHVYAGWPGKTLCEAEGVSLVNGGDVTCPECRRICQV